MKQYLLGFDIGGTKCAVVLGRVSSDGAEIVDKQAFPTEASRGSDYALGRLEEFARAIVSNQNLSLADIRGAGISFGGAVDSRSGTILAPPNLPGWGGITVTSRFEAALGIPCHLENDANACALAEWRWGAGCGCQHLIFLTFGTGMGAGLILNGKLYTGANGLAGEVGNVRLAEDGPIGYGKAGSFEGFCSGGGIARLAKQMLTERLERSELLPPWQNPDDIEDLTAEIVGKAAQSGDPTALEIYREVGHYLGRGLAMLIDILNPEVIVLGSIFARQRDLLWPIAEKVIAEEALPASVEICRVVPAGLGEAIGDYASLSVALDI